MSQWQFLVPLPQSGRMKNTRNHINWQNLNFLLLSQPWKWKICQNQFRKVPQIPSFFETSCLLCLSLGPLAAHHPMLLTLFAPESQELNSGKVEHLEFGRILSPNKKSKPKIGKNRKKTLFGLTFKLKYDFLKVISEVIHISQFFFNSKKILSKETPRAFSSVRLGSVGTSWLSGPSGPSKDSWSFNLNSPGREKTVLGGSSQLVSG